MTKLTFKPGVSLKELAPQMLVALAVVQKAFDFYSLDTVVTSGNDSQHSQNSYHYVGRAFDFRTKHAAGIMNGIFQNLKKELTPLGFDVIWEDQGGVNEHLHVELDKRAGY
jgi:hypothetical protein